MNKILECKYRIKKLDGDDIFNGKFEYLKEKYLDVEQIFKKVFNGSGNIRTVRLKSRVMKSD